MKHTSIRLLLAIVVLKNHESEELNVKTTFLTNIYASARGIKELGEEKMVCKLKKSLYGLK